ncbi:MAG: TIGR04255 family protein [Deltaproteobacteria bacterium]|nr:TIGR04255 family protein [Deltaproteobacteria bacterium]
MNSKSKNPAEPLPSYKQPPVDEVVCGFAFEPLRQLKVPHIGLLWEKLRNEYPNVQHAVPIATDTSWSVDEATGIPLPRIWFISKADNELIQLQLDRFYYNWRHRGDGYPRYNSIIKKFEKAKSHLEAFVTELLLGTVKPLECELTYINHIPKGQGWESINDLPKVIRDFTWQKEKHEFLSNPANVAWQVRFELPEGKGWLNVKLNQATRKVDGVPSLILELTAKGLGEEKTANAMRNWFDLAHEWIVRGFTDLTQRQIQETIWKRER